MSVWEIKSRGYHCGAKWTQIVNLKGYILAYLCNSSSYSRIIGDMIANRDTKKLNKPE